MPGRKRARFDDRIADGKTLGLVDGDDRLERRGGRGDRLAGGEVDDAHRTAWAQEISERRGPGREPGRAADGRSRGGRRRRGPGRVGRGLDRAAVAAPPKDGTEQGAADN